MNVLHKPKKFKIVGQGIPVIDAREKVTGSLEYGVDFVLPRMVHGKIKRSTVPHARIKRIDVARALALPGVLGVVTHEDAPGLNWMGVWDNYRGQILDGISRFVGDEVAAVAATSVEIADAALDLIDVEYEPLPAVLDVERALRDDAPQVREEGNVRDEYRVVWGDLEDGEREADYVIDQEMRYKAQNYAGIGRNACICNWDGDQVTMWTSSQTPSELQTGIHQAFGNPDERRQGRCPSLWLLVRTVVEQQLHDGDGSSRQEGAQTGQDRVDEPGVHGRREAPPHRDHARAHGRHEGRRADHGRLLPPDGQRRLRFQDGCLLFLLRPLGRGQERRLPRTRSQHEPRHLGLHACCRRYHDGSGGRAPRRQVCAEGEHGSLEFRIKNQIKSGQQLRMQEPRQHMKGNLTDYIDGLTEEQTGSWPKMFHLSSGSTHELLVRGAEKFRWRERWKGWGVPTRVNGSKRRGVGVGTGAHCCGVEFGGNTSSVVRVNHDGSVNVFSAAGRQGQGSETTLVQVAAEEMGVPVEKVSIVTGDTYVVPWASGSSASTTMFRTGWATREACRDAKTQLLKIAAREFFDGTDSEKLDIEDGIIRVADDPADNRRIAIDELMNVLCSDSLSQTSVITGRPNGVMPPTIAFARQWAAQFAEVEVDVGTGEIRITDYLAGQDSGTVMNPKVLKNQVIGGAICGAGFVLYEGMEFDPGDGRVLNDSLLDYKLLRTGDFPSDPEVFFVESQDPVGPFGARGAGESPAAAAGPAICQAVHNAIGVWVDVPMTPEAVMRAINENAGPQAMAS